MHSDSSIVTVQDVETVHDSDSADIKSFIKECFHSRHTYAQRIWSVLLTYRIDTQIWVGSDTVTVQARTASSSSSTFKTLDKAQGGPPFNIKVIYENDIYAVVYKPPG